MKKFPETVLLSPRDRYRINGGDSVTPKGVIVTSKQGDRIWWVASIALFAALVTAPYWLRPVAAFFGW